jgi:hypothetical protein
VLGGAEQRRYLCRKIEMGCCMLGDLRDLHIYMPDGCEKIRGGKLTNGPHRAGSNMTSLKRPDIGCLAWRAGATWARVDSEGDGVALSWSEKRDGNAEERDDDADGLHCS